jgi:hypothetical protein
MRIVFICSSLEPGRDGVGDYARRLGVEIIKQGHQVALLALNDKFIGTIKKEQQYADDLEVPVLRIPAETEPDEKAEQAKNWITEFSPDCLSLQYVPFGYHPKGLPFKLAKLLAHIGGNRRWEIMFHELWVGMAVQESGKLKLWGKLQKYITRSLIRTLAPQVIHTQTKLYVQLLAKIGYKANYLAIFSNIAVVPNLKIISDSGINLVVFGLIHTGAAIEKLAAEAATYANKYQAPVTLTFVGYCGYEQGRWAAVWQNAGLNVNILGGQPAEKISAVLHSATIGLSSTAMAVIEKSGAFAAMRSHGLPVLNISKPWTPLGVPLLQVPAGTMPYTSGVFEKFITEREKYIAPGIEPAAIAQRMLGDLMTNVPYGN